MKKLILKILLLSAIVTGISLVVTHLLLPRFWARPEGRAKVAYWEQHQQEFNTVFVGSSRIFHHVNPAEFDSLAKTEGKDIHSFNLGIPSFPFPQSYTMLEYVAANPDVKYVYYEITPVYTEIATELENTPENYYWYDAEHARLLCRQVMESSKYNDETKFRLCGQHAKAFIERNLFIGGAQGLFNTLFVDEDNEWITERCAAEQGFIPLDYELTHGPHTEGNQERRKTFIKDTSILVERRREALDFEQRFPRLKKTTYSAFLRNVYDQFTSRGVKMYFVIPPRLTDYDALFEVTSQLPPESIINLASPTKYPEFYMAHYAFDKGHLNGEGARIFTRKLFELSLGKAHP